jgi:hypothetical protein
VILYLFSKIIEYIEILKHSYINNIKEWSTHLFEI